jgi:hypothetical protein
LVSQHFQDFQGAIFGWNIFGRIDPEMIGQKDELF